MTAHQCFTILGVPPTASKKEIRKAYDELMQVWNPDRFASDSRLQRLAPVVCLLVNEAYCTIDRGQYQPAPEPARPPASKYAVVLELMQWFLFGRVRRGISFLVIAAIPVMLGIMIVKSIRVPNFDPFHPATEAIELPYLPYVPDVWPRRNTAMPSFPSQPNTPPKNAPQPTRTQRRAGLAKDQPLTPWNNGTEMTWSSRIGTGLIHVVNQSPVAVYVRLVQSFQSPDQSHLRPERKFSRPHVNPKWNVFGSDGDGKLLECKDA